jgi:hypothetical protein
MMVDYVLLVFFATMIGPMHFWIMNLKVGFIYIFVKIVFGYYLILFLYLYFRKEAAYEFPIMFTTLVVLVVFFVSLSISFKFGSAPGKSVSDMYRQISSSESGSFIGSMLFILVLSHLFSPTVVKWLLHFRG